MADLKGLSIFLVCSSYKSRDYSYMVGPSIDLSLYLKDKVKNLIFLHQPDPISVDLQPYARVFKKGSLIEEKSFPMFWFPFKKGRRGIANRPFQYFLFKIRDALSIIFFFLKYPRRYDFFIGVEAPNTIMGIFLKKLTLVKYVIYDIVDYSPQRFKNRRLNSLFHFLDKFCIYNTDFAWVQTERIIKARFERGFSKRRSAPQLVKPTGVKKDRIKQLPLSEINRYQLVYVGGLMKRDGATFLMDSFKEILREIPQAKLIIVGEGDLESDMKKRAKAYKIEKSCSFLGIISEAKKLEDILLHSAVGLAPYKQGHFSVKYYNDVSKIKVYLSCGLPVVATKVPMVAENLDMAGAGIATADNKDDFVLAIIKLLKNEDFFIETRKNVINFIKKYTWEEIFGNLFKEMMNIINGKNK